MKRVYKYPLKLTELQEVLLPSGAMLLSAQVQSGKLCLWALVDDKRQERPLRVRIVGTGHPFPDWNEWTYLSTAQQDQFVWHVFFGK